MSISDNPADATISRVKILSDGFRRLELIEGALKIPNGHSNLFEREVVRANRVVAVLPLDVARQEVVLIRQFRLSAHLALGTGEMVEIVAGHVEPTETLQQAARRECLEETGLAPQKLVELCRYMPTPGITDEVVAVFASLVDAAVVSGKAGVAAETEFTQPFQTSFEMAIAALQAGKISNGLTIIALQWLALNRSRVTEKLFSN